MDNSVFAQFQTAQEEDFALAYANWAELNTAAITFDVDWAPDYMLRNVLDILDHYNVRATFYATHDSELLRNIAREGKHEIGLHINLSGGSTQGHDMDNIVENLKGVFPDVVGNRFHHLRYAYRDLKALSQHSLGYDVSTLLFNGTHLLPVWHRDLNMVLLPYIWEDGICENAGDAVTLDSIRLNAPGLKIINFHPMNVYLNCATVEHRLTFMKDNTNLQNFPESEAVHFRDSSRQGAEAVLKELCAFLDNNKLRACTVSEIVKAYLKAIGK